MNCWLKLGFFTWLVYNKANKKSIYYQFMGRMERRPEELLAAVMSEATDRANAKSKKKKLARNKEAMGEAATALLAKFGVQNFEEIVVKKIDRSLWHVLGEPDNIGNIKIGGRPFKVDSSEIEFKLRKDAPVGEVRGGEPQSLAGHVGNFEHGKSISARVRENLKKLGVGYASALQVRLRGRPDKDKWTAVEGVSLSTAELTVQDPRKLDLRRGETMNFLDDFERLQFQRIRK